MSEDKRKILELLSNGKISVEEAERLLAALGADSEEGSETKKGWRPKYLRVTVEPTDGNPKGDRVNVRVPMNLIRAGLKWVSFIPKDARGKVQDAFDEKGIDMDFQQLKPEDLEELVVNLNDLQVEVDGEERVRVYCE